MTAAPEILPLAVDVPASGPSRSSAFDGRPSFNLVSQFLFIAEVCSRIDVGAYIQKKGSKGVSREQVFLLRSRVVSTFNSSAHGVIAQHVDNTFDAHLCRSISPQFDDRLSYIGAKNHVFGMLPEYPLEMIPVCRRWNFLGQRMPFKIIENRIDHLKYLP